MQSAPGESPRQRQARIAQADAEYLQAATALSQLLLGPVAAQLGKKRLLIVAEGALQYLPFGALPEPAASGQELGASGKTTGREPRIESLYRPLIVDHEIVSLPSASVLSVIRKELASRKSAERTVAVLADPVFTSNDPRLASSQSRRTKHPSDQAANSAETSTSAADMERAAQEIGLDGFRRLHFSRQEAEEIVTLASDRKSLKAVDFAANKTTATSADLSQYRIVHFATHGILNNLHPEMSGIVLSLVDEQGRARDGFLRLHEIYNLKLGADLVVLSSCQTALGKEVKGEGLIGLTRGFMYAGTPRVIASLWNVQDRATAELMKRFYQGMLRDGLRPAAALRAAQLQMWQTRRWQLPYYWASFVLQGEWK